jgi:Uma2 family endonuclease
MSTAASKTRLTPAQYLQLERRSETRHEFFHGEMFAMAGASWEHSLIAGNLSRAIGNQFRDRPCAVHQSDMRVLVDATGLYTYPDVVALCGEPRFEDSRVDTLLNPAVIVEVLSESTEAYDRGRKFDHYRRIESLREYVLVAQDRVHVEHFARRGEQWLLTVYRRAEDRIALESIGCAVLLSEIYAKTGIRESGPREGHGAADAGPPC